MIGNALGMGISKRAGLAQVENEIANAGNDPAKLMMAMAKTGLYIPGMDRALAPMFQMLLSKRAASGDFPQPDQEGIGSPQQPGEGQPIVQQGTSPVMQNSQVNPQQQINPSQTQNAAYSNLAQLQQQYPDIQPPMQEFNPEVYGSQLQPGEIGYGAMPALYTPQQIAQQTLSDQQAGIQNSPKAAAMEKYNEGSRAVIRDYQTAVQNYNALAETRLKRQENLRGELQSQSGLKDPSDLATLESMAYLPEFQNINNDKIRAEKTVSAYNKFQDAKYSFEKGSTRPNYTSQDYKRKMDNLQSLVNPFLKYGQIDKAREILAKNDWSEMEIDKIINPLPDSAKNSIKNLPNLANNVYEHAQHPERMSDNDFVKKQMKSTNEWENRLSKIIKPGVTDPRSTQVVKPGTSLILLASQADRQGVSSENFTRMIDNLLKQGKIKLDDYQYSELGKLQEGLGRLKSVGEYLYGE